MTRDELTELINRRLMEDAPEPDTSAVVIPVEEEKIHGIQVAHFRRNETLETDAVTVHSGICTVDDRETGMLGPISFDPLRTSVLLRGASFVAIDSAPEISEEVYNHILDMAVNDETVLVVLTTEERHSIWRMYIGMHWHGTEILEIVPVKNDPVKTFEMFVTGIDRNT